jgi:transcription elongation factor GreA
MTDKPVFLTREGRDRFRNELTELIETKRPQVAERIKQAKELGDLSENAEYDAAKQEQAFVEGRIRDLQYMINNAQLIEDSNGSTQVRIGSTVEVREVDNGTEVGDLEKYMIVGTSEASPRNGKISNESEVGKALIGKRVGQVVPVPTADGDSYSLKIVSVH